MAEKKKVFKMGKIHRRYGMNMGVVIFIVAFIYLASVVISYFSQKHVAIYEVREGSILKNVSYTGVVMRDEEIIPSDANGYINYFISEESKVGSKTDIYTISPEKVDFENSKAENTENDGSYMEPEEQAKIMLSLQTFQESYDHSRFSDTYLVKDSIEDIMSGKSTQSRQAQLQKMLDEGTEDLLMYPAEKDGVIVFSTDGYEELTKENITPKAFSKAGYVKTEFKNNTEVKKGDPIYKLVRDEHWTLAIELQPDMAKKLENEKYVRVKFNKDHQTDWAGFSIEKKGKDYIGFLDFSDSMIRYVSDRYLGIEIILEDNKGLKIPKSAVVEKTFYEVPQDYLTQGGDSHQTGFLEKDKKGEIKFKPVTVFDRDEDKGVVYLNPDDFEKNISLVKPDSQDAYNLKKTVKIKGVYNLNKGYATFKKIDVLTESDEYYIVGIGNSYGVANYDHIALDGDSIEEDDVLF